MANILVKTLVSIILIFSSLSCADRDGTVSCFPRQIIDFEVNLNGSTYYQLNNPEGYVYTKGEYGTGTRGLIIFNSNSGNGFLAYDRNAPHLCPDGEETTLEVIKDTDGFLKIYCPKDGAKWLLQNGQPLEKASVPAKQYRVSRSGNGFLIHIYN